MAKYRDDHKPMREDDFSRLVRRIQPTGLLRDARFARMLNLLSGDPNDPEVLEIINERLQETEMKQLLAPDPFRATNPINQSDFEGSIILGRIPPNNVIWRIPTQLLLTHILICGKSGGGKTNTILLILTQLLENHAHQDL